MKLWLESPLLAREGVPHGFSLRSGGVSGGPYASLNLGDAVGDDPASVRTNLGRLLKAAGGDVARLATVRQVHGASVVLAVGDGQGVRVDGPSEADALVAAGGAWVGVRTADCVPLLLHDPRNGVSAAVHAGWRGTVADVAGHAIEAMARVYGTRPSELRAAIGPSIGPCCFEVGDEVAARFYEAPFDRGLVGRRPSGRAHVDLVEANVRLLLRRGISPDAIDRVAPCTVCDPARFFSHRRDAGLTGRHLSFVGTHTPIFPAS